MKNIGLAGSLILLAIAPVLFVLLAMHMAWAAWALWAWFAVPLGAMQIGYWHWCGLFVLLRLLMTKKHSSDADTDESIKHFIAALVWPPLAVFAGWFFQAMAF